MAAGLDPAHPAALPCWLELDGFRLEAIDIAAAAPGRSGHPELLLLHEGLGGVEHWRGFPQLLARATGCRCVAYSRVGFGRSSPSPARLQAGFIEHEALEILPKLRERLGLRRPVLVGHSTGASMALVHAGARRWPVSAVAAIAPIAFLEDSNLQSIRKVRDRYPGSRLQQSLARYHDHPDRVFYDWADTWLDPGFRGWSLEAALPGIACPVLAIRGQEDEYVTAAQIERIAAGVDAAPFFRAVTLPGCGHAPHSDRPDEVIGAIVDLLGLLADRLATSAGASR